MGERDTRCPEMGDPDSRAGRIVQRLGDFVDSVLLPMAEYEGEIVDSLASMLVIFLARSQHSEDDGQEVVDRIARTFRDTRRQILALDQLDEAETKN